MYSEWAKPILNTIILMISRLRRDIIAFKYIAIVGTPYMASVKMNYPAARLRGIWTRERYEERPKGRGIEPQSLIN